MEVLHRLQAAEGLLRPLRTEGSSRVSFVSFVEKFRMVWKSHTRCRVLDLASRDHLATFRSEIFLITRSVSRRRTSLHQRDLGSGPVGSGIQCQEKKVEEEEEEDGIGNTGKRSTQLLSCPSPGYIGRGMACWLSSIFKAFACRRATLFSRRRWTSTCSGEHSCGGSKCEAKVDSMNMQSP